MKIVVYGLGKQFDQEKEYINTNYNVVAYSDKCRNTIDKFIDPRMINTVDYDYIYITSDKYFDEIKKDLLKIGLEEEKIVSEKILSYRQIEPYISKDRNRGTSITDSDYSMYYIDVCNAAVKDDSVFDTFKNNYFYRVVLEHVTYEYGLEYLKEIDIDNILDEMHLQIFMKNDLIGGPRKYRYSINGCEVEISPTTLRYIKVLSDIVRLFGHNIETVAEIGIGYGGQCRIIKEYCKNINRYSLIDLPEVIDLASKYISRLDALEGIEFVKGTEPIIRKKYDLVISNYAFSELRKNVQDKYLEEVILNSKHGYITWNALSYRLLDGYSCQELLQIIPNSRLEEEKPLTEKDNIIIVW